jgi:DNA modification methylase/DNA-binding XRE family transcriptional regulator
MQVQSTNLGYSAIGAESLGHELRRARKLRNISQKALAAEAGMALATVVNLEQGRGTVAPLVRVLTLLGHRFSGQPNDMGLASWLIARRKGLRLSQDRLSKSVGLSKPTVIQVERERGNIRSLCSIIAALGLPLTLRPEESDRHLNGAPTFVRVHTGDCLDILGSFRDNSFQACITSPPYFQQRDYASPGQIGLESNPEEYVLRIVKSFREVRRVLQKNGTLWMVIGDTFGKVKGRHKDLLGIPWRVAFALQSDGWLLRQDIIIHKRNGLPEPVRDRCVRAHEYLFMFAKSKRYHFDAHAIRERGVATNSGGPQRDTRETQGSMSKGNTGLNAAKERLRREIEEFGFTTRHKRSVWSVNMGSSRSGHFAAFPEALVEPCVLAACPLGGIILDPFAGSGTTGRVARRLNRSAELIEISPEYADLARRRCGLSMSRAAFGVVGFGPARRSLSGRGEVPPQ